MDDFAVDAVAEFGLNKDTTDYRLRPEEWTDLINVRMVDNKLSRLLGHQTTFGTPAQAPAQWFPMITGAAHQWIWMSLAKAYVWNGTSHVDLTPVSPFTTTKALDWQATVLGGIPIINNNNQIPHYWDLNPVNDFAGLPNWPDPNMKVKVIRALGPYLFYANVTLSGSRMPHRVGWSHPANPGALPNSYDVNNPATDAGDFDLTDTEAGEVFDMLPLKGRMFVYKEAATHVLRFAGGNSKWARDDFLGSSGILSPRCVGITGDGQQHFVVSQDDMVIHDGAKAAGLLSRRLKRWLFNNIDPVNYNTSFVFTNPLFKEMWFCYPEPGASRPTRALIWNYDATQAGGKFSEADVPYTWGSSGTIESSGGETWSSVTGTWEDQTSVWNEVERRRTVVGYEPASKFYLLDEGKTRDGAPYQAVARRTSLANTGRTKDGEPIVDFKNKKFSKRCWIRAEGEPFIVRIGAQDSVQGPPAYTDPLPFNPETDLWVDFTVEGRALTIEFSSAEAVDWSIVGYTLEIGLAGNF